MGTEQRNDYALELSAVWGTTVLDRTLVRELRAVTVGAEPGTGVDLVLESLEGAHEIAELEPGGRARITTPPQIPTQQVIRSAALIITPQMYRRLRPIIICPQYVRNYWILLPPCPKRSVEFAHHVIGHPIAAISSQQIGVAKVPCCP